MEHARTLLLTDLRALIADLGKGGGRMSPSIYDTAQVLRLAPPSEGVWPALEWLAAQQQPDGGWGNPSVPRARDVPTLAALLAIHAHDRRASLRASLGRGMAFLRRQAGHWVPPLPDDLPVGVELLLPWLLQEAVAAGLAVPADQYAALIALGRKRRRLIAGLKLRPGTTPVHSWEALCLPLDTDLLDATGGMGHSPAATAAWLRAAQGRSDLADQRAAAARYLLGAAAATGRAIPGLVPTAWPITRFEQSNALYALLVGELLTHPALADVVGPQLDDLGNAVGSAGLGFSDDFVPDGDDTLEALAALRASGRPALLESIQIFANGDHYCAYPGELQPSVSVTAHAAHTLELLGQTAAQAHTYLAERQLADGSWGGDKWNGSWLYTTCQSLVALRNTWHTDVVSRALNALVVYQYGDGGWGTGGASSVEETAYAVLALRACAGHIAYGPEAHHALECASHWLLANYRPFAVPAECCWLAKENYRPERLARTIELSATLVAADILVQAHAS